MINVSEQYKNACNKSIRNSYIVIKYGLYDKKAKTKIESVNATQQAFSNSSQTYDEIKENTINYISCEPNRVINDGTFYFISNKSSINSNQNIGYWSSLMSGSDGTFTANPYIEYLFNSNINFTDLTLYFQEVCKDLDIDYYLNGEIVYTRQIRNNTQLNFETTDGISQQNLLYFDKLRITFIATQTPYRYIKFNEIDFGIYNVFKSTEIKDIDIIDELSIDSSELASNSLNATIIDENGAYDILNLYNKLNLLQERQQLTAYHYLKVGTTYQEIPLGTFLLKNVSSENQQLKLECYDDTYFMNNIYRNSKFYINESATNIFIDVFNSLGYIDERYEIDGEIDDILLTGYIPQVEYREALRLIAEASGSVINKTRYGITYIFKTYDNAVKLFKNNNYSNSSPTKNLYNNVIDINEYNFDVQSDNETLYKGTLTSGIHTINFVKYPLVYSLYKDNYSLLKKVASANYIIESISATSCVVNVGADNVQVEIEGKYYKETYSTKRIKKNPDAIVDDYAITKVDNPMITSSNSLTIANWKLGRREISYSFDCLMIPYIEVGDTCKIETLYKNSQDEYIKKIFVPTHIEFTNSIIQSIEGE